MIEFRKLSFYRNSRQVLCDVSFPLPLGRTSAIIGSNGSGKSTLLKCLIGILPIERGTIFHNGQDMAKLNQVERARLTAYVPQGGEVSGRSTVFDTILLGRKPFFGAKPAKADLLRTERVIEECGLSSLAMRTTDGLSGGERQLVWIAKAMCQEAKVILLDEPTTHLDIRNTLEVMQGIRLLSNKGHTVVLVSHDIVLCKKLCERFILLQNGKVFNQGGVECLSADNLGTLFQISPEQLNDYLGGHHA